MLSKEQIVILQEAYSKVNLEKGLYALARKFFTQYPDETWENFNPKDIITRLNNKKQLNKQEVAEVSFAVFHNPTITKSFLKFLPSHVFNLIEKLLFREDMSHEEISKFLGRDIIRGTEYTPELIKELYFFTVKEYHDYISYKRQTFFLLWLHPEIKKLLVDYFPKPLYYNIIPIDKSPEVNFIFSAETLIQQELPRLLSYHLQQNIKFNASGRPAEPTIAKLKKTCAITEFYSSHNTNEEISRIRTMLMAGLMYQFSITNVTNSNSEVLTDLFKNHYLKLLSPVFILYQLKGWHYLNTSYFYKNMEQQLQQVFQLLPINKWISAENFREYLTTRAIEIHPLSATAAANYLTYQTTFKNGDIVHTVNKAIDHRSYETMIRKSFITGTVYLYAAFGLIEIAYNNINTDAFGETYFSGYDGLQYLRLTSLGAYVLGLTSTYDAPTETKTNKLIFEEDSLIILAEGDLDVINVSLSNYAERLAANRYRVTSGHFLKDCKSKKDIENKIALFKNTIGSKLPANWEDFFKQLLNNAKAVKEVSCITTYKLPADAKDLHKLVAQDPILKSLVLKAENFHILIANSNETKFKNRMKELGYVIE